MRPKTLLVLAVVVLLVGGFIVFVERDLPSTEERAEREKKVLPVDDEEVTALVIERGGTTVRLERQARAEKDDDAEEADDDLGASFAAPAEWRLVEPLAARADRDAVSSLVSTLAGLEKERTLEDVDPEAAGLAAPRARVTLVEEDGDETTLAVGAELPASTDVLVETGGAVYQVAGTFVEDLLQEPGEWRDRSLFPGTRTDVERVALQRGGERVLLARRGDDYWVESPYADRADRERVDALLADLVGLEAERFVDEATPAGAGLEPPAVAVEAVLDGRGEPFRVALGGEEEMDGMDGMDGMDMDGMDAMDEELGLEDSAEEGASVWARVDGQVVTVGGGLAAKASAPAESWRSRRWSDRQVFRVDRLTVADGEGTIELARDGADWRRGEERIAYTAVSDLLYALTDVEATEVVPRAAASARGLAEGEPRLTLTLRVGGEDGEEGGAAEDVLRLYPTAGDVAPATVGDREVVLLIPGGEADKIVGLVAAVRAAEKEDEEMDGMDGMDEMD